MNESPPGPGDRRRPRSRVSGTRDPLWRRLEETDAPRPLLPVARERLRRRLLERFHRDRPTRPRYLMPAAAVLALLAIILGITLVPGEVSADEVIRDLRRAYASGSHAGDVHYLRQILEISGRPPIEEERWTRADGALRALYRQDGEIVGHSLVTESGTFHLPSDRVRVQRRVVRRNDLPSGTDGLRVARLGLIVLPDVTTNGDQARRRALLLSNAEHRSRFERRTPEELVAELASRPDVTLHPPEPGQGEGEALHRLELRRRDGPLPMLIELPAGDLDELDWLSEKLDAAEILLRAADHEPRVLGDGVIATSLESVETISVDAATSRVRELTQEVLQDGEVVYRARKTFLAEAWLEDNPSLFDPETYGLRRVDRSRADGGEPPNELSTEDPP